MTTDPQPLDACSYARYSPRPTKREIEAHETIGAQRERIAAYATMRGLSVVEAFEEPMTSGRTPIEERPQGKHLLRLLAHRQVRHVVVTKLDRLTRRLADVALLEQWERRGVTLHLADQGGNIVRSDTPEGWLMIVMQLVMAEYEPRQTSGRTSRAMKHYQSNGRKMGGNAPFGWMIDPEDPSRIVENAEEQDALELIKTLHEAGAGYISICDMLTKDGWQFRGRRTWHVNTIRRILARAEKQKPA